MTIRLLDLVEMAQVEIDKILVGISIMSDAEFERSGGYSISVGAGGKLYTLRWDFFDTIGVYSGPYGQKSSKKIRRSYFTRNLGKDWETALRNLAQIAKEKGVKAVYIPGYAGNKLLPNKAPTPITIPDKFWFGKHSGKTIAKVASEDIEYILWMSTEFKARNKKMAGFLQKIREFLGEKKIETYLDAKRKEAEKRKKEEQNQAKKLQKIIDVIDKARKDLHRYKGEDPDSEEWKQSDKEELWGDFMSSVLYGLKRGELPRGRGLSILRDIYAQNVTGKRTRRNARSYKAGLKEFDDIVDALEG